jgi:hypothetical protein
VHNVVLVVAFIRLPRLMLILTDTILDARLNRNTRHPACLPRSPRRNSSPPRQLLKLSDGSGTRANRSDFLYNYHVTFFFRCLPKPAASTASSSTLPPNATRSGLQYPEPSCRLQGHLCPDSTIRFLEHAAAASREQVDLGP